VTACPRTNDLSQYDKCILQQLQAITPYLAKGVPSLKLPALDPLFLPSLTVDRNLESLKIKANMSQIRVYGGTNYVVRELKANPNDLTVFIKAQLPHLYVSGDYDVQGRLLLLSLSGIGNFKGNFSKFPTIKINSATTRLCVKCYNVWELLNLKLEESKKLILSDRSIKNR